jgi:hypothetical protein
VADLPHLPQLGKQLGPFSVGGWAAIVVGGVGIGVLASRYVKRGTSSAAEQDAATSAADAVGVGPAQGGAGLTYGLGGSSDGTTSTSATPGIQTNAEWSTAATTYLTSVGADGFAAQQAVAAYMSGSTLTPGQQQLLSQAIGHLGPPPEGAPVMLPGDLGGLIPPATLQATPTPATVVTPQVQKAAGTFTPPAPGLPGEVIVDFELTESGNGGWYLTNLGGVETVGDAPFRGSYLGLPESARQGDRSFGQLVRTPDNHYAIVATSGERYDF